MKKRSSLTQKEKTQKKQQSPDRSHDWDNCMICSILGSNLIRIFASKDRDVLAQGYHRKRIELEDKAKVVASYWGTESLPRYLFCLGQFEKAG